MLDSNICIYLLSGKWPILKSKVESATAGQLAISTIAYSETMLGARNSDTVEETRALFRMLTVLPFDEKAAECYSKLPFKRGSYDRLIAAHALSLDLTLVTNNETDFADVPGLKIENWIV